MFLFLALLTPVVGWFGGQYLSDTEDGKRLQNEIAAGLFQSMGLRGAGVFNILAMFFNIFLPADQKIELFDVTNEPGKRNILDFAANNETLRTELAEQIESRVGLPEVVAEEIIENDAARGELSDILGETNIGMFDFAKPGQVRNKLFTDTGVKKLLASPTLLELIAGKDAATKVAQIYASRAESPAAYDAMVAELAGQLKAASTPEAFKEAFGTTLAAYYVQEVASDEQLAQDAGDLLADPEKLSDILSAAGLSDEAQIATSVDFLTTNKNALETILGETGIAALTRELTAEDSTVRAELASNPGNFLSIIASHPDFAATKADMLERVLASNEVEEAIRALNFSMLPEEQRGVASLVTTMLSDTRKNGTAGEAQSSNLDVFAENEELMQQLLAPLLDQEQEVKPLAMIGLLASTDVNIDLNAIVKQFTPKNKGAEMTFVE